MKLVLFKKFYRFNTIAILENIQVILEKVKQFQRKFYINELIRGVILFTAFGVGYFLLTLLIESWLWLAPFKRWILFGLFLLIELFLLIKFIGMPLFKLMGISKGISVADGAVFIGKYFPEIDDKLLNVIQLSNSSGDSDLLLASIDQHARNLRPIPFLHAINLKANSAYLKYLLPVLFVLVGIFFTNSGSMFSNSLNRVVNPSVVYEKPALFSFLILNDEMSTFEHQDYLLQVTTVGTFVPDDVQVEINGNAYLLDQVSPNLFQYSFMNIIQPVSFNFVANDVVSKTYTLDCLKVPVLESLDAVLHFPSYTKRSPEKISNVGQLIVPRGTKINWEVFGKNVARVHFKIDSNATLFSFTKIKEHSFSFSKIISKSFEYVISSENLNIQNFEPLNFSVRCVADEFPLIAVEKYITEDFKGQNRFLIDVSDDYLVSDIVLCFFIENQVNTLLKRSILRPKKQFHSFMYHFSDSINFIDGKKYQYYFEVWDNDAVLGPKFSKSKLFSFYKQTASEKKEAILKEQKEVIKKINSERFDQKLSNKELEAFKNEMNSKRNLSFKDKTNFSNFLQQQKKHEAILNRNKESLLKTISKSKVAPSMLEKKAELEKRLKESLAMSKKNKLLEELKALAKKLNKEDLVKKLDKLSSQNKQKERSLERLVEMTKRFYVEQKALKIQEDLKELSKKQDALSKKKESLEEQKKLSKEFDDLKKELDAVKKDNQALKKPMDIPDTESEEKTIEEEMQKSVEKQEQQKSSEKNQKKAAMEMMEMAMKMQAQMQNGELEMIEEDMESLRAIVENLIYFSFQQEAVMNAMDGLPSDHSTLPDNVKKQHELKTYFEHIDDSLYVLSLRIEKMSSKIDTELSDAHYFLGTSLDYFSDAKFRDGVKSQRYVMTAVNNLAVMLSNLLDGMMNAMPMPGSGKGKGISLPDIIQKQSELLEQMKKGMKPGSKGIPKNGKSGKKGESGNEGELYRLFQEQTRIKEMFDALAKKKGGSKSGEGVSKKMDQLLEDIIEHGFTDVNLNKMTTLTYELLKLQTAFKEQGEKEERESIENSLLFSKPVLDSIVLKKYFKTKDELLLRQSLPLQPDYKIKVINYFKTNK